VASGETRIVVGTHALAGKGVSFKISGCSSSTRSSGSAAKQKDMLRALGGNCDVLTLTATPDPAHAGVGYARLQDISIIATPPARRQPVRTF
jgi:transcription-repair coupling factor (superfamily II helicase)